MESWYGPAVRDPMESAGAYTGGPFKGLLHTTEAYNYAAARSAYRANRSAPHFTVSYEGNRFQCWQHMPLDLASRALKNAPGGVQTNTDRAVQIEISWQAAHAPEMPTPYLEGIARLMRWIEAQTGIQRTAPAFHPYPPPERLGRESWRMSGPQWDAYNGWCGHQHVPENDHGDPGAINIEYLLGGGTTSAGTSGGFLMALTDQQQADLVNQVTNLHKHLLELTGSASITRTWVRNIVREELDAYGLRFAALLDAEGVIDLDNDGVPG